MELVVMLAQIRMKRFALPPVIPQNILGLNVVTMEGSVSVVVLEYFV